MQTTTITKTNEISAPRRIRRRDEWQTLLSEYKSGDLSQKAFCKLHQLSMSSFYQWKKKLTNDLPADDNFIDISQKPVNNSSHSSPLSDLSSSYQVELELGNGIFLRVRSA
jgi:putative transposase